MHSAPHRLPIKISLARADQAMFLKHLPRRVREVAGEAVDQVAHAAGAVDDAGGFETAHDAVVPAV